MTSAAGIASALPIAPTPGPPATSPIASAWLAIELTVARTLESSIAWFSHVEYTGRISDRASPTIHTAATASANADANAKPSIAAT